MSESREKGFIVIDRRGRGGEEAEPPRVSSEAEGSAPGAASTSASPGGELPRLDFSTFLLSLSTSALYHLGLVEGPEGERLSEPNFEMARQTIDTLEILQEKTRGNLEAEEARLLESLLFELRMRFVEVRQRRSS